ncbi:helix-turn-helix domain-containing protein [Macrococcoides caseolyticum]|uniref:helix-turn-helix domain-containing protein n=1 Tax=Macrococcoides caseolyticum TaxID=69966 RepID=UPI001F1B411D|nr:helix-turn-helix domain-containing protein [Macrococcus caseolyticus]MCE4957831.1 helix-turn-helix domain-containing protein [Macrococcus caseolyticus]
MNNQLYIPLKLEETSLKLLEDIFKSFAENIIQQIEDEKNIQVYMNKKQAASYLGVSFNTLKKFIEEGLPVIDVSGIQMIRRQDIDNFLESKIK